MPFSNVDYHQLEASLRTSIGNVSTFRVGEADAKTPSERPLLSGPLASVP